MAHFISVPFEVPVTYSRTFHMDMLNLKFLEVAVHILMKRFRNYFARKGQKYVRIQTDNLFAENMSATGEF